MAKFQVGDRARVNDTVAFFDREFTERVKGVEGTITDQVEEAPECVWFTPDEPIPGVGPDLALEESELDKLED